MDYEELELRAHVRGLIAEYALQHLTTNYVTWTQNAVANVLSEALKYAPTRSPTDVFIEKDPLETLIQKWELAKLDIYEERWAVENVKILSYLKCQINSLRGNGAQKELWKDCNDEGYNAFLLSRPMSPLLSRVSKDRTPLSNGKPKVSTQSGRHFLRAWDITPIEDVSFREIGVNEEETLGNKLAMDPESHNAVVSLIRSIPITSNRTSVVSTTEKFDEFLRDDSPLPEILQPEILPIFPPSRQPGRRVVGPGELSFIASLEAATHRSGPWLSHITIPEENEEDIDNEHLNVAGGNAIQTPSSPLSLGTPSLSDSSSEGIELFLQSSEGPGEEFLPIDEYQLAKSQRLGAPRLKRPQLGETEGLSAFLSQLIGSSYALGPRIARSHKSVPSSPRTVISMSMLGQPPSEEELEHPTRGEDRSDVLSSDDSTALMTKVVERACGVSLTDEDPLSIILGEKIDEKEELVMDVPVLRPPNEYPTRLKLPTQLMELVATGKSSNPTPLSGDVQLMVVRLCTGFLQKAKGLQSLQLEMSWIPFKYGRTIPTDEEVADVDDDDLSLHLAKAIELPREEIRHRLSHLLDENINRSPETEFVCQLGDEDGLAVSTPKHFDEPGLILTRTDRRRLAGLPPLVPCSEASDEDDEQAEHASVVKRPSKRVRFEDKGHEQVFSETILADVPRLTTGCAVTDDAGLHDSGVYLAGLETLGDNNGDLNNDTSFLQMAYEAEGFDGPDTDGDLFLDMQPDYVYPINSGDLLLSPVDNEHMRSSQIVTAAADSPKTVRHHTDDSRSTLADCALPPDATSQIWPRSRSPPALLDNLRAPCTATSVHLPTLSTRQSLMQYLALCGKASRIDYDAKPPAVDTEDNGSAIAGYIQMQTVSRVPQDIPADVLDDRTLRHIPEHTLPHAQHTYMASLPLVQKRALVRALSSHCAVALIEREHLGGGDAASEDLIIDCETAVLFASLEQLPAHSPGLLALLTRLSWRYLHVLVVFACYPSAWDLHAAAADRTVADAQVARVWSPPAVRAVRNFKRDLAIAEGLETKREGCVVEYAFANSVLEAAEYARQYGDLAEARDGTGGAVWGERRWLTHEERDGEYDLCGVGGINLFAASLLLSQVRLEDFLEAMPEDRLREYGGLVGVERITCFNTEMARRLEAMQLPPSSPISLTNRTNSPSSMYSVPVLGDSEMG